MPIRCYFKTEIRFEVIQHLHSVWKSHRFTGIIHNKDYPLSVEEAASILMALRSNFLKSIADSRPQNETRIVLTHPVKETAEVSSTVAPADSVSGSSTSTNNHTSRLQGLEIQCDRCKARCNNNVVPVQAFIDRATQTEFLHPKYTPVARTDDCSPFTDSVVEAETLQDRNSKKRQDRYNIMSEESWSDVDSHLLDDTESSDSETPKRKISKKKEVPSAKATTIPANVLQKINWNSYRSATRKLLMAVFPRRVLASHSLTGKPSPAFPDKPAKRRLDPAAVDGIVRLVVDRCRVPESIVRTCITTKCADESKMQRSRQNGNRNKENCSEK